MHANVPDRDRIDHETTPDLSAGWREVFAALGCPTSITAQSAPDPDRIAAATRADRPRRYRRKHAKGVSS